MNPSVRFLTASAVVLSALSLPTRAARAQTNVRSNAVADTSVGTRGPGYSTTFDVPNSNYGGAGVLQFSPAGSDRGERQSVIRFDLTGAVSTFNATYGAGNWMLSAVALRLGCNFSVQGSQPNNAIFDPINGGLFDGSTTLGSRAGVLTRVWRHPAPRLPFALSGRVLGSMNHW